MKDSVIMECMRKVTTKAPAGEGSGSTGRLYGFVLCVRITSFSKHNMLCDRKIKGSYDYSRKGDVIRKGRFERRDEQRAQTGCVKSQEKCIFMYIYE